LDSEGHDLDNNSDRLPAKTPYVESGREEFGLAGDAGQTEEVADENNSLIWTLVKQVGTVSFTLDSVIVRV